MQHICGCWSYDREANCLINVITEEKIHYRDRLEWHKSRAVSQIHRLVYVSGKTEAPIFVSYDLEREYPEKDQDPSYAVTYSTHIYTVDFSLTIEAMDTNATTLPFGLWQRLCEAAPQALLFWPERWPHTEDDSGGPDLSRPNTDQSRKVVLVGAWRNARWVPDGRSIHECDTRATPEERAADFYLLPREHWDLPAPNAPPPPALQFNVPRADKLASLKLENWPDEAAAFQYLRDHGVLLPEPWWRPREARPEAWSIEDIPHCRSETDFRFFAFLDHLQFKNGHGRNVVLYDFAGATSMGGFFSSTELVAQHIDKSLDSIFRINNQKKYWFYSFYREDAKYVPGFNTSYRFIKDRMFLPDPDEPYRLFRMPRIREVQQLLLDAATAWTGISDDDSQDERLRPIKKLELRKQPVAGIWGFPTGRWFPTHGMNIEHIIRT